MKKHIVSMGAGKIYLVILITMSLVLPFEFGSASQGTSQEQTGTGMVFDSVDLSLNDLVNESEVIVLGNVVDQNYNGTVPDNSDGVPLIRNAVQVEKVIKGNYTDKTIDVITEGDLTGHTSVGGSAKLNKGERVVLFLQREKVYDGHFAVTGMEQGKYEVGSNDLIKGKFLKNGTSIPSFEALIEGIAEKSKSWQ